MRLFFKIISFAGLIAVFQGCSPKGTPIGHLTTPQFVPQSQPDSVVETGIGQDPSSGAIFLQWYSCAGAAGYRVYRSDSSQTGPFVLVANVISSSYLSDTSIVDFTGKTVGLKYFYYLRAYTADGSLSNPSDTISYALLERPTLYSPLSDSIATSQAFFTWDDHTGGGYTVIRVRDVYLVPATVVWVTKRFQVFGTFPTRFFNYDTTASQQLISGHSYQWRVDRFNFDGTGRPYEGARSQWGKFFVK